MSEPITMHRPIYRSACACAVVVVAFFLGSPSKALADEPLANATMQCERAAEPGRVKCSIELHSVANRSIAWADVAIIELPDFTSALKGRIGPSDATIREATTQKWAFGLVAKKTGQGEAKARVRAVVCESSAATPGKEAGSNASTRCTSTTVDVKAVVQVG